jgi:hypothetical protein
VMLLGLVGTCLNARRVSDFIFLMTIETPRRELSYS